ncbi:MAG: hypothetical protein QNK37_16890 [Acidobacteriota bacterium]|nr:hypothetical protein [Acidobacteriota bacterium]
MAFIVNRWVRGEDFHGREDHLAFLKEGSKKTAWILGNRRVGKTSLLRQVAWLCREGAWGDALALYWDLQGAATANGLKDSFLECLEDDEDMADELGLDIDALEDLALFDVLNKFRRKVKGLKGRRFLLLIDECEELVDVAADEPNVLNAFRKLTQSGNNLEIVLAGSYRFMDLDESDSRTSLFLPDFLPPRLLGPFSEEQAVNLLAGNEIAREDARSIYAATLGNPHLVQVVGEHFHRLGNLDEALAQIKSGKVGEYFFQSNFQCLPEPQRGWWRQPGLIAKLEAITPADECYPYLVQAAILTEDEEQPAVSPLLRLVLGEETPKPAAVPRQESAPGKPKKAEKPAPDEADGVLAWFQANPSRLLVLPTDGTALDEATNPPGLVMMASIQEPKEKMHAVLDGACPEFVRGENPDERTAVYLVGLSLYRRYFGKSPFHDMDDPWERAGALAESDVPVRPAEATEPMENKTAMVLMRCLKADPADRYQTLKTLTGDLG